MNNYYNILGVAENASDAEIKAAYRKKALQYHPDRNPSADAANRFIAIKNAYDTLSDPILKKMYDQELLYQRTTGTTNRPYGYAQEKNRYYYQPASAARKTPKATTAWWVPGLILIAIQLVVRMGSQPTYQYSNLQLPDSVVRTIMLQHDGKLRKTDSVIFAPGNSTTDSANHP